MNILQLAIFTGLLLFNSGVSASCWELYKDFKDEGISIFYRVTENNKFVEFMGKTSSTESISSLVAVIRDTEEMPKWVYQLKFASIIEKITETERVIYFVHESPFWFLKNRDSVVHSNIYRDEKSFDVVISGKSAASMAPRSDNYVRIEEGESEWRFSLDTATNVVNISFKGFANPGGVAEIASYLMFLKNHLWELPYTSLRNLKTQVKKVVYKNAGNELVDNLPTVALTSQSTWTRKQACSVHCCKGA